MSNMQLCGCTLDSAKGITMHATPKKDFFNIV